MLALRVWYRKLAKKDLLETLKIVEKKSQRSNILKLRTSYSQASINIVFSLQSADHVQAFRAFKVSRFQYEVSTAATKKNGHNIFPSYKKSTKAITLPLSNYGNFSGSLRKSPVICPVVHEILSTILRQISCTTMNDTLRETLASSCPVIFHYKSQM